MPALAPPRAPAMPSPPAEAPARPATSEAIARLDHRHEELLSRIDELNEQILAALSEAAKTQAAVVKS